MREKKDRKGYKDYQKKILNILNKKEGETE